MARAPFPESKRHSVPFCRFDREVPVTSIRTKSPTFSIANVSAFVAIRTRTFLLRILMRYRNRAGKAGGHVSKRGVDGRNGGCKSLKIMVGATGLEPVTSCV